MPTAFRALSAIALPATLLTLFGGRVTGQQINDFRFEATTLGGRTITQKDFENSVLLVDYWGTWCGPCVGSVPTLQKMYAKYKHHGLEIVGLCYERGAPQQAADGVRRFAANKGLTYPLALGNPAAKAQVPGFRGYPTMLFFGRGLQFRKMDVGVSPDFASELEKWIRVELGLAEAEEPEPQPAGPAGPNQDRPRDDFDEQQGDDAPPDLEEGQVFKPGDGDRGFRFTLPGADGKPVAPLDLDDKPVTMEGLAGKPFVLALTSSWDQSAESTGKLLQSLHEEFGGDAAKANVIAAHLEMPRQRAKKMAAMQRFRDTHELTYRAFPAGLSFQRKVHTFTGMPLLLVFDGEGVLMLRETGVGEAIDKKVRDMLKQLTGGESDGGEQPAERDGAPR